MLLVRAGVSQLKEVKAGDNACQRYQDIKKV